MTYENFKDLARMPTSGKLISDNGFATVSNPKYHR